MYKFEVSKYKNVEACIPKKNEGWITDDINVNSYPNNSNLIKSSASLIAYFREGGNLGIVNINDFQQKPLIIRSNGNETSDFDFSPFDDGILATGSPSGRLNIWQFSQLIPNIVVPNNTIHSFNCLEPISSVKFHSTVETIVSYSTKSQLKLYDINKQKVIIESNKCSQIQSIDCKYDGKLFALTDGGDNQIKIWDPRIDGSKHFAIQFNGHENERDSRVVWLGDKPHIVSTGFNKRKAREAFLWDTRSTQKPVTSVNEFEPSTGVWIPLFDFDTQMLFIAGRNDSAINHWEISDLISGSAQLDNNDVNKKSVDMQVRGATLASKRALNIMNTEVNRVILLGANSIAPVSYKVTRKTYREFHSDLFPETKSPDSNISCEDWLQLKDNTISTISLNPGINKREKLIRFGKTLGSDIKVESTDSEVDHFLDICRNDGNNEFHIRNSVSMIGAISNETPVRPQFNRVTLNDNKVRDFCVVHSAGNSITGLRNLGNTCFMNAVIQCLLNTTEFSTFFTNGLSHINKNSKFGSNGELVMELAALFRAMAYPSSYKSISPKDFKQAVSKHIQGFIGCSQHDSYEFLVILIEKLHADLNESTARDVIDTSIPQELSLDPAANKFWKVHINRNKSIITDLFEGLFVNSLTCLTCRKQFNSFEEFRILSLPLSNNRTNLNECLNQFFKPERLSGESAYDCPTCKTKREAEKKVAVWKLPKVLIIHLKRFLCEGVWRQKNQIYVDFPIDELYIHSLSKSETKYSLYGVVNHHGTLEGGHYTAFSQNKPKYKWHRFDDQEITQINAADVKTQAACILFYKCC